VTHPAVPNAGAARRVALYALVACGVTKVVVATLLVVAALRAPSNTFQGFGVVGAVFMSAPFIAFGLFDIAAGGLALKGRRVGLIMGMVSGVLGALLSPLSARGLADLAHGLGAAAMPIVASFFALNVFLVIALRSGKPGPSPRSA